MRQEKSDTDARQDSKKVLFEEWKASAARMAFGVSWQAAPVEFIDVLESMQRYFESPRVSPEAFRSMGDVMLEKLVRRRAVRDLES